ncbi:beta-ketoacyl synthase chain length factor [Labilibaculum sp. K2S]|uniref:beta-ketoacyl synthase chain length factor n=1 Tax=Labilibaculum sp. K2S TaxID=3056386 RepID=UPI0025A38712|nr:beta-ketoacyl synthase chain length factor [Labilibaculum sp. K2S]MDM8158652.1 beta-ketoacyl synthase chain length factor [Labilibaculum sp. K2S]
MAIYINASSMVSAQETLGTEKWPVNTVSSENSGLKVIDPVYKEYIPPAMLRRMSRLVKFSLVSAFDCLHQVEPNSIDAIITTTGLGCIDDTGVFLKQMHENGETLMNPTAFIRSTHNAVGGQIALIKGLRVPNYTYSQKETSFETGLIDAIMMIEEGEAKTILLGGFDELTPLSLNLWKQMGCLAEKELDKNGLKKASNSGVILGEGAGFFVLSTKERSSKSSKLVDIEIHRESTCDCNCLVQKFLDKHNLHSSDINLLLLGLDGTPNTKNLTTLLNSDFEKSLIAGFKHCSGSFDTDTSFALWMAHTAIQNGCIGEATYLQGDKDQEIERVLIVNSSRNNSYSFILLTRCQSSQ